MSAPAPRDARSAAASISAATIYDRYFPGLETIVLLRRDDDLLILPVRHAAAGGYLLKLRNGAGDRVVNAPDFFREHGLDDEARARFRRAWDGVDAPRWSRAAPSDMQS